MSQKEMDEATAKDMYVLVEMSYIEDCGRDLSEDNSDLFPFGWYATRDYVLKSEILAEAIQTKKPITETENYQLLLEGIR